MLKQPSNLKSQIGSLAFDKLSDKVWLEREYVEHDRSTRDIASQLACGKKAVNTALRRHNIILKANRCIKRTEESKRNNFERNVPAIAIGKVDNADWLKDHFIDQNLSALQISLMLGVSRRCIYKWAKRHGLKKDDKKKLEAVALGYKNSVGFDINSVEAAYKRMSGRRSVIVETIKGGQIRCHSSWEKCVAERLDSCTFVTSFIKDGLRIPYVYDGITRTYFPDFVVLFANGVRAIFEVKADRLLSDVRVKMKLKALEDFSNKHEYKWAIIGGSNKLRESDLDEFISQIC